MVGHTSLSGVQKNLSRPVDRRGHDRPPNGQKVRPEGQLAQQPPKDKYSGSAQQCVRIVKLYASDPLIELMKLYRLLLFAWWTGNGDMHLKNPALLVDEDDITRLTLAVYSINSLNLRCDIFFSKNLLYFIND